MKSRSGRESELTVEEQTRQSEPASPPHGGTAPPTVQLPPHMLPVLPPKPAVWPTVLGIIATAVGALGVLMYGCGSVMNLFSGPMMSSVAQTTGQANSMFEAQMQVQTNYIWWQMATGLASVATSVLLLFIGIDLIRRKPWTRKGALIWAVAKIIAATAATLVQLKMSRDMFDAMQQAMAQAQKGTGATARGVGAPGVPMPFFGMMKSLGYAGSAISMLWYAAMPVFALIWFNRRKVKAEVASWRRREAEGAAQ